MDALIGQVMADYHGHVPGASVMVRAGDAEALVRSFGYADLEKGVPAAPASCYRLASMTKQFTAAATLLLAQERQLSLEDPVRAWLPALPATAGRATLRHLLTHTAGVIDYEELIPAGRRHQLRDADVLQLLAHEDRTYFEPGTRFRYSDSGYALLGLVIARAAGEDFASFLRRRIFLPLGMESTVAYEQGVSGIAARAFGYSAHAAGWLRTDQSLTSAVLGDGGVYSSVADLTRWDAALSDTRLLSARSLHEAFAPATATADPNVRYGLGWRLTGESAWHSGETLGFRSVIVRLPSRRLTVIVLTNRGQGSPYDLALQIVRGLLPEAELPRAAEVMVGPDPGAHPLPPGAA